MTAAICAPAPHHTNAAGSIGGDDGRAPRYDLHAVEDSGGVGLAECEAGDLWLAWEGARARRVQGAAGLSGRFAPGRPPPARGEAAMREPTESLTEE